MIEPLEVRLDSQYVIGVDPGTNTGLVVWDNVNRAVTLQHVDTPVNTLHAFSSLVQNIAWKGLRPTIVVERFDFSADTLRKRDGVDDVVNILGMLWAFATVNEIPLHKVARADSKNFVKDEALKSRSLWLGSRHTRDALRVVFTWLAQTDHNFVKNFWVN